MIFSRFYKLMLMLLVRKARISSPSHSRLPFFPAVALRKEMMILLLVLQTHLSHKQINIDGLLAVYHDKQLRNCFSFKE